MITLNKEQTAIESSLNHIKDTLEHEKFWNEKWINKVGLEL